MHISCGGGVGVGIGKAVNSCTQKMTGGWSSEATSKLVFYSLYRLQGLPWWSSGEDFSLNAGGMGPGTKILHATSNGLPKKH